MDYNVDASPVTIALDRCFLLCRAHNDLWDVTPKYNNVNDVVVSSVRLDLMRSVRAERDSREEKRNIEIDSHLVEHVSQQPTAANVAKIARL